MTSKSPERPQRLEKQKSSKDIAKDSTPKVLKPKETKGAKEFVYYDPKVRLGGGKYGPVDLIIWNY